MTDAKRPDYQAGYEKGMTIALSALAGGNMICECAGMMGSLMGCSLEAMVLDNDLIGAVQRSLRGIEVTEDTLSYEVIEATALGVGHYLGAEQTLSLMRSEFLYPTVGDRTSVAEWEFQGSPEIMTTARKRVQHILATHYPDTILPQRDLAIRSVFDIRLAPNLMRAGNARWPVAGA